MRTLAITWNDLLARIEAAMIRVTQFAADASHELRNPIAYIRTAAEYSLGDASLDEEVREAFRAIADEASLTGELLENLLMLAHPNAEFCAAELAPVDVSSAINEVVQHFAGQASRKRQTLSVVTADFSRMLLINPLHLRRLLTAVLDNALKYTPERGRIAIECDASDGVILRVTDSGIGIGNEHRERVFDRFYRVDPARSDVSEGVGLGLPIAKWLTERYGGTIRIESELGSGTTVIVAFPQRMVVESQLQERVRAVLGVGNSSS
jgi:signal transduction histidine kinase